MHLSLRTTVLAVACTCSAVAQATPITTSHPLVDDMLYVDVAWAGERLVVVGDRGAIMWSEDRGTTWSMAETPDKVLLTAVCFADADRGWAVGHDATVLATTDGGKRWVRQYSDALHAGAAESESESDDYEDFGDPYAYDDEDYGSADQGGLALAPDTSGAPFLDILCGDGEHLIAVGGYGYTIESTDGGASWINRSQDMQNPDGWHFYAIERLGNASTLLVAGERGTLLRSRDNGVTWQKLDSPYSGTFFGITEGERILLVHGMQGQVWASRNGGDSWRQVRTGVTRAINAGAVLDDGTVVLAGASGSILVSHDNGNSLALQYLPDRASISGLVPLGDGALLMVGAEGIKTVTGIR